MRKFVNKYTVVALAAIASFSSCQKNFLDINENPNSATAATPDLILSAGLNRTAAQLSTNLNMLGAVWAGQVAPPTDFLYYVNEKQYNITSSFYTNVWDTGYDILNDFEAMEVNAKAANMNYYVGMAKIMKAFNFQIIVDAYGNVPFTEALKGTKVLRPKYDQGTDIYPQLITLIDEGIAAIKGASPLEAKPGADDILFGGNITKWIKFANTLKLRVLIRQSEVSSSSNYLRAEAAKITAEGTGFLGANEGALVNPSYISSSGKLNPLWENYFQTSAGSITNYNKATRATELIIAKYKANNDARMAATYNEAKKVDPDTEEVINLGYVGVPLGAPSTGPNVDKYKTAVTSAFKANGAVFRGAIASTPILTSAESLFLQAEAVERGLIAGDAAALYNQAIRESFAFAGVASSADDYIALPAVSFVNSTNKVEAIINQKWLALNVIGGWELWNDFRRTGFPSDNPLSLAASEQKHPARLLYPNSELGTNSAEVKAQGVIDPFTSKIFWNVSVPK